MKSYLFPGQGTQTESMADEIIAEFPKARAYYETTRDVLGVDLTSLSREQLENTRFAQLAIVVHSVASLEKRISSLKEAEDAVAAGFSLGEYTALYAAGIIGFIDLIRLVNERARLMQEASKRNPGSMFAIIGLPDEKVEEIVARYKNVYAVNYNCPGQLVIAGEAIETENAAEALLSEGARRAHRLAVNGAFHTPLMGEAAAELKRYAESISFRVPQIPVYSNFSADRIPASVLFPEYLEMQMISPVRFTEEIRKIREDGYPEHIEIGPGRVLSGLTKKI